MAQLIRTRTMAAAVIGALLLVLSGCTSSDPEDGPSSDPEASSTAPTDSADPSASTSPEPTPSDAAATGPLLEIEGAVQMNAPAGWEQSEDIVSFKTEANPPEGGSAARLGALSFPGTPPSLDEEAKLVQESADDGVKRLDDIEVGGEPFYQFAGPLSPSRYTVILGATTHGYQVNISFDFSRDFTPEQRDQLVSESLATFAWK